MKNLKKNFLQLFSIIVAVGVYLPPSLLSLVVIGCAFVVGIVSILFDMTKFNKGLPHFLCWANVSFTLPDSEIIANIKRNWYFPVSAMAFFHLYSAPTLEFYFGLIIALLVSVFISSQISSILVYIKKNNIILQVISILTAFGICWNRQAYFDLTWNIYANKQALEVILIVIWTIIGTFGVVFAVFFVYMCVIAFWKKMIKIFLETEIFSGVRTIEWSVYGVLLVSSLCLMFFSFTHTDAFYETGCNYDIIYTSDSPFLMGDNVYITLNHYENDIRQPLFAVFAAPFIGIPYLIGRLPGVSVSVQVMIMNSVQIVILLCANFILAKMMKLNWAKRICFMMVTSCTYAQLLFALMMEQYIIAYFWLILCMYLISKKYIHARIALWGAGGTLLTSMVMLPFMSDKSPVREFKEWFKDTVKYGIEFVVLMLAFCRLDIFFNLVYKITFLSDFTGKDVMFSDKLYQYTNFICNCFVAPNAGPGTILSDKVSWQLNISDGVNYIGIVILLLVIISAVWNRGDQGSRLAFGWVLFSMMVLVIVGWGTKENGLILYALYFGWAFLVLMFRLIEKVENKFNVKCIVPLVSTVCVFVLAAINVPAIMEMVRFAIDFFPV